MLFNSFFLNFKLSDLNMLIRKQENTIFKRKRNVCKFYFKCDVRVRLLYIIDYYIIIKYYC